MKMTRQEAADRLGVEVDCSDADLKKAYRKASSKHHPDKGGDEEEFKKSKYAYELLDGRIKENIHGHPGQHPDFDMRGWQKYYKEAEEHRKKMMDNGRDIQSALFVTMDVASNGGEVKHTLKIHKPCVACNGSGFTLSPSGFTNRCDTCKGYGKSTSHKTLSVTIPKNTRFGATLRLKGMGETKRAAAGVDGDLYVLIHFEADKYYKFQNGQIYVEAIVSPLIWLLGGNVSIATPHGIVVIKVPPCVPEGKLFRMRNKGIDTDDLFAVIIADWSSIDIDGNKELIEAIQKNIDSDKTKLSLSGKFRQATSEFANLFEDK